MNIPNNSSKEQSRIGSLLFIYSSGPFVGTRQNLCLSTSFESSSSSYLPIDMAKELAAQAKEAFVDDDFDVAVDLYSKAIDLDPSCADFFADRAQAYIKLQNFTGNFLVL